MMRRTWMWFALCSSLSLAGVGCGEKAADPPGKPAAKAEPEAGKAGPAAAPGETKPAEAVAAAQGECPPAPECACPEAGKATGKVAEAPAKPVDPAGGAASEDVANTIAGDLFQKVVAVAPAGALVVGAMDVAGSVKTAGALLDSLLGTTLSWEATVKDLTELFQTRLGINPFELTSVGMVVVKKGPVFLIPWGKPLVLPADVEKRDFDGVTLARLGGLWFIQEGEWVLAGENKPVRQQLAAIKGTESKLGEAEQAIHRNMAKELGSALLLVTGDIRIATGLIQEELPGAILDSVGVALDSGGGLHVMLKAPEATQKMLLEYVQKSLAEGKKVLEENYRNRASLGMAEAMGVVVAWHQFEALSGSFQPKQKGEYLVMELAGATSAVLPLLGVSAAIAVPAFIKYMRKAKTSEAIDMMDKMYKGAAMYYSQPKVDDAGARLPCAFPPSGTYAGKKCCEYPDQRCPANPEEWSGSPWKELNFQLEDSHYFRYEFNSEGSGPGAKATIAAYGDLDCDGIESTFTMEVAADPEAGNPQGGECMVRRGKFFVDKETE